MEIAIVGAGNQGTALGWALGRAGHKVVFGGRARPGQPTPSEGALVPVDQAVRPAEVVMIVVPAWTLDEVLRTLGGAPVQGKIVVDVTNPLTPEKQAAGGSSSNAERVRDALPGTRVVKAFNTVFSAWLRSGGRALGEQLTGFVASDDPEAKAVVLRLVQQVGLDPVDVGPLAAARQLEAMGVLLVQLGAFTPLSWDLGVRLVHPHRPTT